MTDEHECPSPDDCDFSTAEISELTAHINEEHAGEYQREGWPDTPAGRATRSGDGEDDQGGDGE